MLMRPFVLSVALLAGCQKEPVETSPAPAPAPVAPNAPARPAVGPHFAEPPPATVPTPPTPTPTPPAPAPVADLRVELISVTLADDCGGTPPPSLPTAKRAAPAGGLSKADRDDAMGDMPNTSRARGARAYRCQQTSMQLSITASDASRITVKSVEVFDPSGVSLGKLKASKPTRWSPSKGAYVTWDEMTTPGTSINVSYVLQQPAWDTIEDRMTKTYTLKTVVSVGGVDRAMKKQVTLTAPAALPPNVRT